MWGYACGGMRAFSYAKLSFLSFTGGQGDPKCKIGLGRGRMEGLGYTWTSFAKKKEQIEI